MARGPPAARRRYRDRSCRTSCATTRRARSDRSRSSVASPRSPCSRHARSPAPRAALRHGPRARGLALVAGVTARRCDRLRGRPGRVPRVRVTPESIIAALGIYAGTFVVAAISSVFPLRLDRGVPDRGRGHRIRAAARDRVPPPASSPASCRSTRAARAAGTLQGLTAAAPADRALEQHAAPRARGQRGRSACRRSRSWRPRRACSRSARARSARSCSAAARCASRSSSRSPRTTNRMTASGSERSAPDRSRVRDAKRRSTPVATDRRRAGPAR